MYHEENPTHAIIADATVNKNHQRSLLQTSGVIDPIDGVIGGGTKFDHVVMEVIQKTDLPLFEEITFSSWIQIDDFSKIPHYGTKWQCRTGNPDTAEVFIMPDKSIRMRINDQNLRTSPDVLNEGEYQYIAATYNSNEGGLTRIFVNGVVVAEGLMHQGNPLQFEMAGHYPSRFLTPSNHKIDEVRLASRAFSPSWIALDYYTQRKFSDFLNPSPLPEPRDVIVSQVPRNGFRIRHQVQSGVHVYADREYGLQLPPELQYFSILQTPNSFRQHKEPDFLQFHVDRPTQLMILLPNGYNTNPAFIRNENWTPTSYNIQSPEKGLSYQIFTKTVGRGLVSLPGPRDGDVMGNQAGYSLLLTESDDTQLLAPSDTSGVVVMQGVRPGVQFYSDSTWKIQEISEELVGTTLLQTKQADFDNTQTGVIRFQLQRGAAVYIALDKAQTELPQFMQNNGNDKWQPVRLGLKTDAPGFPEYVVYRKYFTGGDVILDGARSGGENQNQYNYAIFLDDTPPEGTIKNLDGAKHAGKVKDAKSLDIDSTLFARHIPKALQELELIQTNQNEFDNRLQEYITFELDRPARVFIGVDGAYQKLPGFLVEQNWELTEYAVDADGTSFEFWSKVFQPGRVTIPGPQSDQAFGNKVNYVILIEFLETPFVGYAYEDLKVRAMEPKLASSNSFILQNPEVLFAKGENLSSWTWRMSLNSSSGIEKQSEIKVLAPLKKGLEEVPENAPLAKQSVQFTQMAKLSDLAPELVDDRDVWVSAKTLETKGDVLVDVRNLGEGILNQNISVILFEDRNGNYKYDAHADNYLGEGMVITLGAGEKQTVTISLEENLSFPENAIFAFVDAKDREKERNEYNNVARTSDNACESWKAFSYIIDDDSWRNNSKVMNAVLGSAEPIVAILTDSDSSGWVGIDDRKDLLFIYGNKLYAIDGKTGEDVFEPIQVGAGYFNSEIKVEDWDGDEIPEIIVGNQVIKNDGTLWWNGNGNPPNNVDADQDGYMDSVSVEDDCFRIISTQTGKAIFSNQAKTCPEEERAVASTFTHIEAGDKKCLDISVSYPRIEGNKVTVRVANAGYEDLPSSFSVLLFEDLEKEKVKIIESRELTESLKPGEYIDLNFEPPKRKNSEPRRKITADLLGSYQRLREISKKNNTVEIINND